MDFHNRACHFSEYPGYPFSTVEGPGLVEVVGAENNPSISLATVSLDVGARSAEGQRWAPSL